MKQFNLNRFSRLFHTKIIAFTVIDICVIILQVTYSKTAMEDTIYGGCNIPNPRTQPAKCGVRCKHKERMGV